MPHENLAPKNIEHTSPEFKSGAGKLIVSLDYIKNNLEKLHVYTYGNILEKTSTGKDVLVNTILCDSSLEPMFKGLKDSLFLIAKDKESNQIVSIRTQSIIDPKHNKDNSGFVNKHVSGTIVSKIKGQGYASATDKVLQKILQRYVNEEQDILNKKSFGSKIQLTWIVENQNLFDLKDLEKKLLSATEKNNQAEMVTLTQILKEKKNEQERWRSLYGDEGQFKLSKETDPNRFLETYEKEIHPNEDVGNEDNKKQPIKQEDFYKILEDVKKSIN